MNAFQIKMALSVALCVSVFTTQVMANNVFQDLAAGIQAVQILGDIVKSKTGSEKETRVPLRNRVAADPRTSRRVVIDESRVNLTGNRGRQLRGLMAAKLRTVVSQSGKVSIVMGRADASDMAELQDDIHESGRYSKETRSEVGRGQWMTPTDVMKLSGSAEVTSSDQRVNLSNRQNSFNVRCRKITAIVRLTLEPIEVVSGVHSLAYEASAKLTKVVNFNVNGYRSGTSSNQNNAEEELLYQAANQALVDLVDQLDPEELVVSGRVSQPRAELDSLESDSVYGEVKLIFTSGKQSQINIPESKPLSVGSQIWFVRAGKASGKFKVLAINSQSIKLQKLSGAEPTDGDGFAIFN